MANQRPTQADVAKLAGVSQPVVSHVLNKTDLAIAPETRQRVLLAIEHLGYVPNKMAQGLRTKKTYTIASIIPDITNPFYPAFQRGIQSVANDHNYDLIIYDTQEKEENEKRSLSSLERARVDGAVVVIFHQHDEELKYLIDSGISLVQLLSREQTDRDILIDQIFVDNKEMARMAVNHLIDLGYTRIGMIAGKPGTPPHRNRVLGYKQALTEHNLGIDETLIQSCSFTEEGGGQALGELLKLDPQPDAVFAANDIMALGAMRAIREAGLSIPGEIALFGIDNIPASNLVHPPLTTISQRQEDIGRRAAEMLFDRISGSAPEKPQIVEMPFELIDRGST